MPAIAERSRGKATFSDASDDTALLALQGPKALAIGAAVSFNERGMDWNSVARF